MSKIIAVYGSPSSGKTAFAIFLAKYLADQKQNTILLSTNKLVPMLKVMLPTHTIEKMHSVGGIFLSPDITQDKVCKRIIFPKKGDYLGYMGYATGDTPNTYSGIITPAKIQPFYSILLSLTDYLIVDCTSNILPSADPLGSVAVTNADLCINLLTPDSYGIEYYTAMLAYLQQTIKDKKQLHIAGMSLPTSPIEETEEILQLLFNYELPFTLDVKEWLLGNKSILSDKQYNLYQSVIKEIGKEEILKL